MMRKNVYTTDAEEKIAGYNLNARQRQMKEAKQSKFDNEIDKKYDRKIAAKQSDEAARK